LTRDTFDRRDVVKLMAAAGAAVPAAGALWPDAAHAATPAYDPAGKFELDVKEVEFRRNGAGRMLMARIYQPKGPGPFPTVLDLHGGAWNRKDRRAEEPMDRSLAASGLLVVAVDMTIAPEAPYPACVQDANYAVRWLKANAATWNGDAAKLGIYGSSSGGHVAELLALRPRDGRYNAIPLAAAPNVDASVGWVATRSPISDTSRATRTRSAGTTRT
jgi:acetyl esterase/lipase